jgi:ubiquitin carboxyl-terminal hydrolase 8
MFKNEKFKKYRNNGLTGLANLGNTCFINSTLQCLSHTYELNDYLDKDGKKYEKDINDTNESLILVEWDKLRELMWSENCIIAPGKFIEIIRKIANLKDRELFTGFAQNDLPEFLLFLMDGFNNAIKKKVDIKFSRDAKNDKDKLAIKCFDMLRQIYNNEYSELFEIFYGIHVSQINDLNNKTLSETPEHFFIINLCIPDNKTGKLLTLYDCFDNYTKNELMSGDNKWFNEITNEKQVVNKSIKFFSLPNIMLIDIKRFNNNLKKNDDLIDIPINNFDLSKYVIGYNKYTYVYDLYAVCNHYGSSMGGHYNSLIRNANGKWYLFDDDNISEINEEKLNLKNAYCLFYRKRKI